MAEIYGAKYVLLLAVGGSSIISLATPWMARTSLGMLVASRILMGAIQSGAYPAMYALVSKWLTMTEASMFIPMLKLGLKSGNLLASLVPGLLSTWPAVFYFTGSVGVVWSIMWLIIATSKPEDNSWVSTEEEQHIVRKKKKMKQVEEVSSGIEMTEQTTKSKKKQSSGTPWIKIITAPSVIGLIIVKVTLNYSGDFLNIELPSYFKYVHHSSKETISAVSTSIALIQVIFVVFAGWLAKVAVRDHPFGLDKTSIRKIFQATSSFSQTVMYLLITFDSCNIIYVGAVLQLGAVFYMFMAGGETLLPFDLSQEYPATIVAIANSVANTSGSTVTLLAGLILADQGGSYRRWNLLMLILGAANFVGGLAFCLLVKAEPIIMDQDRSETDTDVEKAELPNGHGPKKQASGDEPDSREVQ